MEIIPTAALNRGHGRLREMPNIVICFRKCWFFELAWSLNYKRWSLREVVGHGQPRPHMGVRSLHAVSHYNGVASLCTSPTESIRDQPDGILT